jgi:hypothetical protein
MLYHTSTKYACSSSGSAPVVTRVQVREWHMYRGLDSGAHQQSDADSTTTHYILPIFVSNLDDRTNSCCGNYHKTMHARIYQLPWCLYSCIILICMKMENKRKQNKASFISNVHVLILQCVLFFIASTIDDWSSEERRKDVLIVPLSLNYRVLVFSLGAWPIHEMERRTWVTSRVQTRRRQDF